MKLKNKKGFTLIELLAVIVILAILILLATPSVIGLMKKAKFNSFKLELESLSKIAETAYASGDIDEYYTMDVDDKLYCYDLSYLSENGYTDKTFEYPGVVSIYKPSNPSFSESFLMYKNNDFKGVFSLCKADSCSSGITIYIGTEYSYDFASGVYDTVLGMVNEETSICDAFVAAITS